MSGSPKRPPRAAKKTPPPASHAEVVDTPEHPIGPDPQEPKTEMHGNELVYVDPDDWRAAIADEYTKKQQLIVDQFFRGAKTKEEVEVCLFIGQKLGLSYLGKQIYAIPRKQKRDGQYVEVLTPQTGIDGYRLIADRTGLLCGIDDAEYEGEETSEFKTTEWEDGKKKWITKQFKHPLIARVRVWKLVGGAPRKFEASARWSEYFPASAPGLWPNRPYGQLGKCAEALALRKGFPNNLSGIYTTEEMQQADARENAIDVTAGGSENTQDAPQLPPPPVKPDLTKISHTKFMEDFNDAKSPGIVQSIYNAAKESAATRSVKFTKEQQQSICHCYLNAVTRVREFLQLGDIDKPGSFLTSAAGVPVLKIAYDAEGWASLERVEPPTAPGVPSPAPAPISPPTVNSPSTSGVQAGAKPVTSGGTAGVPTGGDTAVPAMSSDQWMRIVDLGKRTGKNAMGIEEYAFEYFQTKPAAALSGANAEALIQLLESELGGQATTDLAKEAEAVFGPSAEEGITPWQTKMIHVVVAKQGIDRAAYEKMLLEWFPDLPVPSSSALTRAQADVFLDRFCKEQKITRPTEPPPEAPLPESQY